MRTHWFTTSDNIESWAGRLVSAVVERPSRESMLKGHNDGIIGKPTKEITEHRDV